MSTPEPPPRPERPDQPPTERLNAPAARGAGAPAEPAREYERLPPEGPPPGHWWESPWLAILAALIALLIGGGVGYAIGENSESHTGTATNTTTVTQPPKTVTNTVTSTTIKETASPANQANEERRREAESDLRKVEKENQELKRKLEESKP